MNRRLLFLLFALILLVGIIVWLDQVDDQKASMYQLGQEHCMLKKPSEEFSGKEAGPREQFIRFALADSSLHFYNKAIVLQEKDTFLISSFTRPENQMLNQAMIRVGAGLLERKMQRQYEQWFIRSGRAYLIRWIYPEPSFRSLLLIDQVHFDSLQARRVFEQDPLQGKVGRCN